MRHAFARSSLSDETVLEVLTRLWQIKLRSIDLLERWSTTATEYDVKAGLGTQLIDERRHLRLLADEIKRRGGRQPSIVDHVVTKAFTLVQSQPNDQFKLCAFHRGIKAPVNQRCYQLIKLGDAQLTALLEQILPDEERHLRWADTRLRSMSGEEVRRCNAMLEKLYGAMDAVWRRPFRALTGASFSYLG
jgi:hypothetical protein